MGQASRVCLLILCGSTAWAQEVIPRPDDIARQKEVVKEPTTVHVSAGSRVKVQPRTEISVTFAEVVKEGSLTSRVLFEGPPAPEGYLVGSPPIFVELSVSAKHSGSTSVCIHYAKELFPDRAADLRVLRRQEESWIDKTHTLDREKQLVCAEMDRLGVLLLTVRSVRGLYEDLALAVRQLPKGEIQQSLIEPILQSRQAALDGKQKAFQQHLKILRKQLDGAAADRLSEQFREWIQYFLKRIEERVGQAGPQTTP